MKSLDELEKIKKEAQEEIKLREDKDGTRVIIAMGTCGIAAGARNVLKVMLEELDKRELDNVTITQTGCIGLCNQEPIVEVQKPGEDPVTYGEVGVEEGRKIVAEHIVNDKVVKDLVIK